jgi:bacillithiol system protein YtxJ
MNELQQVVDLDAVFQRSHEHPVLIFKHSETCPVSARAHSEYLEALDAHGPDSALVVVQRARPVSDAIADRTGVRHESPQALLISGGEVLWHASHHSITAEALGRQLDPGSG